MSAWLQLLLAIVAEVVATSALKASDGFTRLWPAIIVVLGYSVSFYCLSLVLKTIPVGITYAVWSGLGIVLITLAAWWLTGDAHPPTATSSASTNIAATSKPICCVIS